MNILKLGRKGSPIIMITDWVSAGLLQRGQHMPDRHNEMLRAKLAEAGLSFQDMIVINPCPTCGEWRGKPPTAKQHKEWVFSHRDEFMSKLEPALADAKIILVLGKSAAMQVFHAAVAVTKKRGSIQRTDEMPLPILATLSPAHVLSRPELARDMETDLRTLSSLQEGGWDMTSNEDTGEYEFVTDLSDLLANPPAAMAVDVETTGLQWAKDATVLTIQMTYKAGHAYIIPVSSSMFAHIPRAERKRVLSQFKKLMANPNIKVFGHNFKFDYHMMSLYGIKVANWWMDTLQLAFAADENMQSKSLSECIRRWVPDMSGYSDEFDASVDKSRLIDADIGELVKYGGGDTDATFRLCKVLCAEVSQDKRQWLNVTRIQMPALRMYYQMEKQGITVDQVRLRELGVTMRQKLFELESQLLHFVPKRVKQKHFAKGLSFGRRVFLQDILFSKEGLNLRAITKLADGSPATDAIHLSNFAHVPFVQKYTELQKVKKLLSTYVGQESAITAKPIKLLKSGGFPAAARRMTNHEPEELQDLAKLDTVSVYDEDGDLVEYTRLTEWEESGCLALDQHGGFAILADSTASGLWKHLMPDGKVHPSFFLDKTVTGRSSSRDPNFQNTPKRGDLAKPYRRIFVPHHEDYTLIECDQSQAELRFAACESLDPVMLDTYRRGGDIHALTASKVAGVALSKVTPELRQKAKAVNFGFLYTMGPDGFVIYAKSSYGVIFTKAEAKQIRETYFSTYKKLRPWHDKRRAEVRQHGQVRGLLGALRRLPSIYSADHGVQASAERQAINSPIQRIGSDVTLMSMSQFSNGCPKWILPIGTIHDSGVIECPKSKADRVAAWIKWCFINPPLEELFGVVLPLPLDADVAVGPDLGSMVEYKNLKAIKPPWIV